MTLKELRTLKIGDFIVQTGNRKKNPIARVAKIYDTTVFDRSDIIICADFVDTSLRKSDWTKYDIQCSYKRAKKLSESILDMEKIQAIIEEIYGVKTKIDSYGSTLSGSNELFTVYVAAPCEINSNQWVVRLAATASYDSWDNSNYIAERYESEDEGFNTLCEFLRNSKNEACEHLFKLLSESYTSLYEDYEELRDDWLRKSNRLDELEEWEREMCAEE